MERQIKVTKIGEELACMFDDRISIEFSPDNVDTLKRVFQKRAENERSYYQQGQERELKDLFEGALSLWENERKQRKLVMNAFERQNVPCPDCKGTGESPLGEDGRLYPCGLCLGRKTILESPEAYATRLEVALNKLVSYVGKHCGNCPLFKKCRFYDFSSFRKEGNCQPLIIKWAMEE